MLEPVAKNNSMERPLSVYDNLNTMISPPPANNFHKNGNANDLPFSSISFKFDDSEDGLRENGSLGESLFAKPTSPVHNSYSAPDPNPQIDSAVSTKVTTKSKPAVKTLSEAGASELENVAIDKPVISDAKSKFFGIKHYSAASEESTKLHAGIKTPQIVTINNRHSSVSEKCEISKTKSVKVYSPSEKCVDASEKSPVSDYTELNGNHIEDTGDLDQQGNSKSKNGLYDMDSANRQHSQKTQYPFQIEYGAANVPINDANMQQEDLQNNEVVYMATTVPQNMKGSNIAGRHTPTRNSLRHSRMLVVNKNYQGSKSPNPLDLRHPTFTKVLLILQLIIGKLTTLIGIWILLWAPNTRTQDNPYWSGLSMTFAGIFGLVVIRFKRIKRQKLRENCYNFFKINFYVLAILTSILCLAAFTYALIHLKRLTAETTKCSSTNILIANAACVCTFGTTMHHNNTSNFEENNANIVEQDEYRDLSCTEVTGAWKYILVISTFFNLLGFILTVSYIILFYLRRDYRRNYTTVRTNPF